MRPPRGVASAAPQRSLLPLAAGAATLILLSLTVLACSDQELLTFPTTVRTKVEFVAEWGGTGPNGYIMMAPVDLAFTLDGEVLVADYTRGVIHRYTRGGEYQGFLDLAASEDRVAPVSLAVNSEGRVFVARDLLILPGVPTEEIPPGLFVYSPDGTLLAAQPLKVAWYGLAAGRNGEVYSASVTSVRHNPYPADDDTTWVRVTTHNGEGAAIGVLELEVIDDIPARRVSLAAGPHGETHVLTRAVSSAWIDVLDVDGVPVRRVEVDYDVDPQGEGFAVSPEGTYALTQKGDLKIAFLDPKGSLMLAWGEHGNDPGEFVSVPASVAFDAEGRLYVADTLNRRVQVFDVTWTSGDE